MFERLTRSWDVTKTTFAVMKQDRELFLFPILSVLTSILFLAALIGPGIYFAATGEALGLTFIYWILLFIIYFGLAAIATFFNVATVYTAATRMGGGDATLKTSLAFAKSRLPVIIKWSLLSATVGILLRALENFAQKFGQVGQLLVGLLTSALGLAWGIGTIFVIPVLVYENTPPFTAVKRSIEVLKATWGETLVKWIGIGIIKSTIIIVALFLLLLPAAYAFFIAGSALLAIILAATFLVLVLLTHLILAVADQVFNTALYVYAKNGVVPTGYREEQLASAVKNKKQ